MSDDMTRQQSLLRLKEFEHDVRRRTERRLGLHGSPAASKHARLTRKLACHAALPVLLTADFVHLLRINFFNGAYDDGEELSQVAEQDLLFSDLCTELGGNLYEIAPDVRLILLEELLEEYNLDRVKLVAALLWSYTKRRTAWGENQRLENAQRLTALNFLDPDKARDWTVNAKNRIGRMSGEEDWARAMIAELDYLDRYNKPIDIAPTASTLPSIGSSLVPGVILRQVLQGHAAAIRYLDWSPDGRRLASASEDQTLRIWDVSAGLPLRVVSLQEGGRLNSLSWSPDGGRIASGSGENIVVWDATSGQAVLTLRGHTNPINCIAWSPDGQRIASAAGNNILVWGSSSGQLTRTLQGPTNTILGLAWSPDGRILASTSGDGSTILREISSGGISSQLQRDTAAALDVTWSPDGLYLAVSSQDGTLSLWDAAKGDQLRILEGHTDAVGKISFSMDGRWLVSSSMDKTIRIWRTDTWECVAVIQSFDHALQQPAFVYHHPQLAISGMDDTSICILNLEEEILQRKQWAYQYATAKLVLVGDSGVGKTGLGWRLAHGEFKEHSSSHGQQFWLIPELKKIREDGTECEVVLWDLAGQPIYRIIHSIFLDNVDAALIMFDATNRQDPLKGVQFWLEQLKIKKQLPPSVLVGARLDRGASVISQSELDQFCQKHRISGGYIGISSKSGEGLDTLFETLKVLISWDQIATTVTTASFKRIKEFILSLKENADLRDVVVSPDRLQQQLQSIDKNWQFSDAEMLTALGHLENHGYVVILKGPSAEEFVLLAPELLVNVASSILLLADKHLRELAAINETELLQGKYLFEEFNRLGNEEQQILLHATIVHFLEHRICFRERLGDDNLLIFPSLIRQKRPLKDDTAYTDDVSYIVRGRIENFYASLVVLIGSTSSFNRINQWQNQAQYETEQGNVYGFRLIEEREGEVELILYHEQAMVKTEQERFQELFEYFLYRRDVEVTRIPSIICRNGHRQERSAVIKRLQDRKKIMFCDECGEKIELPEIERPTVDLSASDWLKREEAIARLRSTYETHLARVKAYRRNWATPRCYISSVEEQKVWAERITKDLMDAGILMINDSDEVQRDDFVILLDSAAYQKAWQQAETRLGKDATLIRSRLSEKNNRLISLAIEDVTDNWHEFEACTPGSLYGETHYPVTLFNLVLNIYAIPLTHQAFAALRTSLHEQWQSLEETDTTSNRTSQIRRPTTSDQIFAILIDEVRSQTGQRDLILNIQEIQSALAQANRDGQQLDREFLFDHLYKIARLAPNMLELAGARLEELIPEINIIIQNIIKILPSKVQETIQQLSNEFRVDVVSDSSAGVDEVWKSGQWTLNDLERFYTTIGLLANLMGGSEKIIQALGGITAKKSDIGSHGGEALAHTVTFSLKGSLSAWTIIHELAHAWDANYNWRLSRTLEKYTGGSTRALRSLGQRLTRNWDAGPTGPENTPGRRGRLPGCNAAGYFYGDKPSGSNWAFNRQEDFAESLCMYVGWERENELSQMARNRTERYTLPNGAKDAFGVIDNWTDYAKYFYPEDGDYTRTKRWKFVDDLVQGRLSISRSLRNL